MPYSYQDKGYYDQKQSETKMVLDTGGFKAYFSEVNFNRSVSFIRFYKNFNMFKLNFLQSKVCHHFFNIWHNI